MNNVDFANAVHKFLYFNWNWNSVPVTYPSLGKGMVTDYLPEFFLAFEPNMVEHLYGKFKYFYDEYGSTSALIKLYGDLDTDNSRRLLFWVNENFDGQPKLNFNESA